LEQLAAMKLQKTNADESQQNSQQQTTRPTTNQTHRQDQEGMMTEQGEGQRMNGLGRSQLNATSMNNAIN
jgi:hypothetical protein